MSDAEGFLDTNVLLYVLTDERSKAERALSLVEAGAVISVQVLNEFASVATRKSGLPMREVRDVLATIRQLCPVVPLTVEIHDLGLELAERYRLSIYDAMIVAAALGAGCRTLFTEDLNDGQAIEGLTIRNPFAPREPPA
jgi:predicted nucleic acid-binding protein